MKRYGHKNVWEILICALCRLVNISLQMMLQVARKQEVVQFVLKRTHFQGAIGRLLKSEFSQKAIY